MSGFMSNRPHHFGTTNLNDSSVPHIHLVNPMDNPCGGSENRTAELYALLSKVANVTVWSEHKISSEFARRLPIKKINRYLGNYPKEGTLVFVGCYFKIGSWLKHFRPGRIIALYNTPDAQNLEQFLDYLRLLGLDSICEYVFASEWLRARTGLPGIVQVSPINLNKFRPKFKSSQHDGRAFTIGRLSRDVPEKHHPDDIGIYQWLAGMGGASRIMGGTVLEKYLNNHPGVMLMPQGALNPEVFLCGLDCFFYRTSSEWPEPHGRVVTEAMACGLPVVCGSDGGYREFIKHGINGFLINDNQEAQEIFMLLKNDQEFSSQIGIAARKSMEEMFSSESIVEILKYYCGSIGFHENI